MLILEASRDELLKPFQTVAGVVEKRSTLPVLSNVLIEGEGGRTTILGTDLEIQISTDGPQMPMMSDFRLTVNAKKVHDILKALPVSAQIAFEYEQNKLTPSSFPTASLPPRASSTTPRNPSFVSTWWLRWPMVPISRRPRMCCGRSSRPTPS